MHSKEYFRYKSDKSAVVGTIVIAITFAMLIYFSNFKISSIIFSFFLFLIFVYKPFKLVFSRIIYLNGSELNLRFGPFKYTIERSNCYLEIIPNTYRGRKPYTYEIILRQVKKRKIPTLKFSNFILMQAPKENCIHEAEVLASSLGIEVFINESI